MEELKQAISSFVTQWNDVIDNEHKTKGYSCDPSKEYLGVKYNKKFAIIYRKHSNGQESSYAHVALTNGENKKIGTYSVGDIFKADTWNSPAKHKRGSVFDEHPTSCVSAYSVKYLR